MTDRRGRRVEARMGSAFRYRLEQNALLRDKVGHHLTTVEHVIESLRQDLATCREQNRSLARKRDRLHQQLTRTDLLQTEHAESESRWRESQQEYQREAQARQTLERDKRELSDRCAELEEALARERDERQAQGLEVECLQEQVDQLQEIIDLLTREREIKGG